MEAVVNYVLMGNDKKKKKSATAVNLLPKLHLITEGSSPRHYVSMPVIPFKTAILTWENIQIEAQCYAADHEKPQRTRCSPDPWPLCPKQQRPLLSSTGDCCWCPWGAGTAVPLCPACLWRTSRDFHFFYTLPFLFCKHYGEKRPCLKYLLCPQDVNMPAAADCADRRPFWAGSTACSPRC